MTSIGASTGYRAARTTAIGRTPIPAAGNLVSRMTQRTCREAAPWPPRWWLASRVPGHHTCIVRRRHRRQAGAA